MKIGLLFGSFNPVHSGHLSIAEFVIKNCGVDEVWFVVTPQNPFKLHEFMEDENHRLKMVEIAIEDKKYFKISDMEFTLPKPAFTVDTLEIFHKKHPEHNFVLILGSDLLEDLHKWKSPDKILENHEVIIYPRGKPYEGILKQNRSIKFVNAPLISISSTEVRNAIRGKSDLAGMLPEKVKDYISEKKLYSE